MNSTIALVVGMTVTLVAIYLFLANGDESSKVIRSLSGGYVDIVTALQGRPNSGLRLT